MRMTEQKAIKEETDNKILTDGFCHLVGNAMVQNGFIVIVINLNRINR